MTLFSELQVTWNQVQGLTRVGSQLCSTYLGSFNACRKACSASPAKKSNAVTTLHHYTSLPTTWSVTQPISGSYAIFPSTANQVLYNCIIGLNLNINSEMWFNFPGEFILMRQLPVLAAKWIHSHFDISTDRQRCYTDFCQSVTILMKSSGRSHGMQVKALHDCMKP
jgi:hypothetical protein